MPANILSGLSGKQLRQAAGLRDHIDRLEKQLTKLLGTPSAATTAAPTAQPERTMSPAARAKISAAQKRRWAKHRAAKKKKKA